MKPMIGSNRTVADGLFDGVPCTYREDAIGMVKKAWLAYPGEPEYVGKDMAAFMAFMHAHSARFIDIAAEFTRKLHGAQRECTLKCILDAAYANTGAFDPLTQSPGQWFRAVCKEAVHGRK